MRPSHPYQVRDTELLRRHLESSQRVVPHSVRSLAKLVRTSRSTISNLLTGREEHVTAELAQSISVAFGAPLEDLFMPRTSVSSDIDETERQSE